MSDAKHENSTSMKQAKIRYDHAIHGRAWVEAILHSQLDENQGAIMKNT